MIEVSRKFMVFENGKCVPLQTKLDTEIKMHSLFKHENEVVERDYIIVKLETEDVLTPIENWSFQISGELPSLNIKKVEKKIRKNTKKWVKKREYLKMVFPHL